MAVAGNGLQTSIESNRNSVGPLTENSFVNKNFLLKAESNTPLTGTNGLGSSPHATQNSTTNTTGASPKAGVVAAVSSSTVSDCTNSTCEERDKPRERGGGVGETDGKDHRNPDAFDESSIENWLQSIGLSRYADRFSQQGYSNVLHIQIAGLDDADLDLLRIEDLNLRLRLRHHANSLKTSFYARVKTDSLKFEVRQQPNCFADHQALFE